MSMQQISDSQFHMWRTLFALAHVDHVVSKEELRFMVEVLEDLPFTAQQKEVLNTDIHHPQDPARMFAQISDQEDQIRFFRFAHDMVWVDGEFGTEEQEIMIRLQREHIRLTDIDDLVGKIDLELESDYDFEQTLRKDRKDAKKIVHSFRERFLRDLAK